MMVIEDLKQEDVVMDEKARKLIDQILSMPIEEEPAEPSEWDAARKLNEEWNHWRDRHQRGEISNAEYNAEWLRMVYTTDVKTVNLASRLDKALRESLNDPPIA